MSTVTAQLNYLRQSPRKMRLVANAIRGKSVVKAQQILTVLSKRGALPLFKLVRSAIANAEHNFSLVEKNLVIKSIMVDGGPVLKRWMPKAHGRATPVRQRTCHVKLVLGEKVFKSSAKEAAAPEAAK